MRPFRSLPIILALTAAVPGSLAGQASDSAARLPGPPPLGLDVYLPVPADNPLTPERVELGRRLFFDPLLSADGRVACASCHRPERAFADSLPASPGVFGRRGRRNTPSLMNAGYGRVFFWDWRSANLEAQVVRPIQDPNEMGMSLDDVVARLRADQSYAAAFRRAFGHDVSAADLARALASFVRTLRSGDAPVDRYRAGAMDALSETEKAGFRLFVGKAGCATCHVGPTFTDQAFHNTGVAWRAPEAKPDPEEEAPRYPVLLDPGRFLVSGDSADLGAFKTPTLRNVALTAPYMHDGSIATLEEVVQFYSRGGRANPYLDQDIHPLHLTADEKRALVAFLHALTGPSSRE